MGIIQITSAAVAAAVLSVVLKRETPVFSLMLGIGVGVIIVLSLMPQLKSIISIIQEIGEMTGENGYVGILFKIITYIAQFASDICSDAGENALAGKAVLAGKILVAFYSMPIVAGLINQVNIMFK